MRHWQTHATALAAALAGRAACARAQPFPLVLDPRAFSTSLNRFTAPAPVRIFRKIFVA